MRRRIDIGGLIDLALPRACAGCGLAGPSVCPDCVEDIAATTFAGGPKPILPWPAPRGLGPVWTTGAYSGALACVIAGHKDAGRDDVRSLLALLLARAIRAARVPPDAVVVGLPSSPAATRRRGDAPVARLVAYAAAAGHLPAIDALRVSGRVRDAVGLSSAQRARNISGVMRASRDVAGQVVVLADDIVTTGATMREAVRAIEAAGGVVVARAAIAATPRRFREEQGETLHNGTEVS